MQLFWIERQTIYDRGKIDITLGRGQHPKGAMKNGQIQISMIKYDIQIIVWFQTTYFLSRTTLTTKVLLPKAIQIEYL